MMMMFVNNAMYGENNDGNVCLSIVILLLEVNQLTKYGVIAIRGHHMQHCESFAMQISMFMVAMSGSKNTSKMWRSSQVGVTPMTLESHALKIGVILQSHRNI